MIAASDFKNIPLAHKYRSIPAWEIYLLFHKALVINNLPKYSSTSITMPSFGLTPNLLYVILTVASV